MVRNVWIQGQKSTAKSDNVVFECVKCVFLAESTDSPGFPIYGDISANPLQVLQHSLSVSTTFSTRYYVVPPDNVVPDIIV